MLKKAPPKSEQLGQLELIIIIFQNMKKIKFSPALIIFILIIIIVNSIEFIFYNKSKNELKEIKLNLSGQIKDIKKLKYGHGYGFCLIEIKNSNISNYDYRDKKGNFFLIIKNQKCLIISPNISEMNIGDKVIIEKENFTSYNDKKSISEFNLTTLPSILLDAHDSLIE